MTEQEMFEELAYTRLEDETTIKYVFGTLAIIFHLHNSNFYESFEVSDIESEMAEICGMNELKAINKQCKELGWLDE